MVNFNGQQYASWIDAFASLVTISVAAPPPAPACATLAPPAPLASTPAPVRQRQSLAERYRPRTVTALVGQEEVAAQLSAFVSDPYPTSFIFWGETGVGKSSAGLALAADLGCDIDASPAEWGGVYSIPSGENTPAALGELWPQLWNMPFGSKRGWKVVIVNEVENLQGKVELLWLDKLENLPPQTVVVFTTNRLESLPSRFVDRCIGGAMEFRSSADDLGEAARALAAQIWRAETGGDIPADVLARVVTRSIQHGQLSLRRVVQNLVPLNMSELKRTT